LHYSTPLFLHVSFTLRSTASAEAENPAVFEMRSSDLRFAPNDDGVTAGYQRYTMLAVVIPQGFITLAEAFPVGIDTTTGPGRLLYRPLTSRSKHQTSSFRDLPFSVMIVSATHNTANNNKAMVSTSRRQVINPANPGFTT